ELTFAKETLQTTVEELETTNEELKSTNEELQSNNEELQSTNEELETSREELQSLNEELTTVNSELQGRIDELSETNDDMRNLLDSTDIAVLFLDGACNIKRFTPRVRDVLNIIQTDIGRYVGDISSTLERADLPEAAKNVLSTLRPFIARLTGKGGRLFEMKVMPYRTVNNMIDGTVITFNDITDLEKAKVKERLAAVLTDSNDAITVHDIDGRITAWNRGAEKIYGYTEKEALKMNIEKLIPPPHRKEYRGRVAEIGKGGKTGSFFTKRAAKNGKMIDVWISATKLSGKKGGIEGIATTERKVTGMNILDKNRTNKGTKHEKDVR
ncbi:PAS domain-containing protein, partial [Candidatus Auribacterota bacterium]